MISAVVVSGSTTSSVVVAGGPQSSMVNAGGERGHEPANVNNSSSGFIGLLIVVEEGTTNISRWTP